MATAPGVVVGEPMAKKGTTPYVTHFVFRPLMSIDIAGLGTATNLEAVGTTQNMNGEKMLDKMSARCAAPRRGRSSNLVPLPDSPGLRHHPGQNRATLLPSQLHVPRADGRSCCGR